MKLVENFTITDDASSFLGSPIAIYENQIIVKTKSIISGDRVGAYLNDNQVQDVIGETGRFGISISIYKNVLVIGSSGFSSNKGRAYIYEKNNNSDNWELKKIVEGNVNNTFLGQSVSVYENTIAIGRNGTTGVFGETRIYKKIDGNWNLVQILTGETAGDNFGNYVSLNENYLAVSAIEFNSTTGKVFIYELEESWKLVQTFQGTAVDESFGSQISLSENNLSVSNNDGGFFIYTRGVDKKWKLNLTFNSGIDSSGSTFIYKNIAVYGNVGFSSNTGKIFAFKKNLKGGWELFDEVQGEETGDFYGISVYVNKNYVAAGSQSFNDGKGKAYFYKLE